MNILIVPAELIDPIDQLSVNTLARCTAGLDEWRNGHYDYLLVCGGKFLEPSRQKTAAADLMRRWFMRMGVPNTLILTESASLDTYQNIEFSLRVLRHFGDSHSITVVTQYQHALRFMITFLLAHRMFITIRPIRQPAMSWRNWFMEWSLILYHAFDWRGTGRLAKKNRHDRQIAASVS